MLKWESTTPLGSPVLPLLKMTVDGVVDRSAGRGAGEPLEQPDRGEPGQRERDQPIAPCRIVAPTSSSQISSSPSGSSSLAFSRKARLVTTVRSPACAAADSIAGPAGGEVEVDRGPARRAPPPGSPARRATLVGSRMPTADPGPPSAAASARASATAPASALMHETRGRLAVGEGQPERVPAGPADELVVQRPAVRLAVGPTPPGRGRGSPGGSRSSGVSGGSGVPNETVTGQRDPLGQPAVAGRAEDAGRRPGRGGPG